MTPNMPAKLIVSKVLGRGKRLVLARAFRFGIVPRFKPGEPLDLDVFTLGCERDLPEVTVCIQSFLHWVGTPKRFVIVSDGTLTAAIRQRLQRLASCVEITEYDDFVLADLPESVVAYSKTHFMGRKLAAIMSLPIQSLTLYTDSDVLFFRGGRMLRDLVRARPSEPHYLVDVGPTFDSRLIVSETEKELPANAGFILLPRHLDYSEAVHRLSQLEKYSHWSEQTVNHLALRASGAKPFARDQFVCSIDDMNALGDWADSRQIAMRHYVSCVRHKLWLSLGRSLRIV
jgi:hypothetical protein